MNAARFAVIPARAIQDDRISHAQLRVLAVLGTFADGDGWCWPSYQAIADRCGIARRHVMDHVKALSELGYVATQQRRDAAGKRQSNRFQVRCDFPPGDTESHQGLVTLASAKPGDTESHPELTHLEHPKNKKEKNDRNLTVPPPDLHLGNADPEPDFETWWSCWRRAGTKRGRGHAAPAWRAAIKGGADPGHLCRAVGEYMDWTEGMGAEPDTIKHPATWLHAKAWLDDLPDPSIRTMDHAPRRQSQADEFVERANQRATDAVRERGGDGRSGNGVAHPLQAFAVPCGPRDDATDL